VIALHILSGNKADSEIVVRHFPFVIGRGDGAQLALDEAGVWEQHMQIDFQSGAGFSFRARSDAPALVNGERAEGGMLRNGDLIELGSAQLRFWLARTEQKSLRWREALTWCALLALFAAQATLIFLLRR
jgi:hypothetical protein